MPVRRRRLGASAGNDRRTLVCSATLVLSKGDLLDMRTKAVSRAFIDGRSISLENKQTYLERKFRSKYGLLKICIMRLCI